MDGLNTAGSPKGDAGGRMSLDDVVKAAVAGVVRPGEETAAPDAIEEPAEDIAALGAETTAPDSGEVKPPAGDPAKDAATETKPAGEFEAPKVWPKDRTGRFAKLTPDAKRFALELEKAHNQAFTKNAESNAQERKFAGEVRSLFSEDMRRDMNQRGMTEVSAIRAMSSYLDRINNDPAAHIKELAQRKGLKLETILGSQSAATAQPAEEEDFVDPTVKELKGQVGQIVQVLTSAFQHQQQQTMSTLEQEVNAFEAAADGSGNPKYPHFQAVFDQMMHLMNTDPQLARMPATQARQKLEKAYEMAVYLNPEVRSQVLEADFTRRQTDAQAAAAAARAKAAGTRKGSPGANGTGATNGKMSLDEIVKSAVSSANRR